MVTRFYITGTIFWTLIYFMGSCTTFDSKYEAASESLEKIKEDVNNLKPEDWSTVEKQISELEEDMLLNPGNYPDSIRENANQVIADFRILKFKKSTIDLAREIGNETDRAMKTVEGFLKKDSTNDFARELSNEADRTLKSIKGLFPKDSTKN